MTPQLTLEEERYSSEEWQSSDDTISGAAFADLTQWRAQAYRQLMAIARLPRNWDSYGADRVDGKILASAEALLSALHEMGVSKPHINPTRTGGIQFDWESGTRYLEIALISPNRAEYFFEDRDTLEQHEGILLAGDTLDEIAELFPSAADAR